MPSPPSSLIKLQLIPLLLIIILDSPLLQAQAQSAEKPDQVIEFFRHGARTPIFKYDLSWPVSEGVLTTVGMLQHYELGKKLSERYPHLVESGYNPNDVYVLSNFVPRCIDSALAHVSSLFRGKTSTLTEENPRQEAIIERIAPHLPGSEAGRGKFVPIKVDVVSSKEQEYTFNGRNYNWCPIIAKYRKENEHSAEMAQAWNIFQGSANRANAFLPINQQIRNMAVLYSAFDAFNVDLYENRRLPGNINDPQLVESLNYGQAYYHEILEHLQLIQKGLTSFPTLNSMIEQLENFREGKSPKKLALFSGHDLNIFAILSAFGIISIECLTVNYQDQIQGKPLSFPNCQYPKFASNLIFEFYNNTANPYVKFYYNDVLVSLCDGQESCSYDEFLSFVKKAGGNYTPQTWLDTCNGKPIIPQEVQEEEKTPKNENKIEEQEKPNNKTNVESPDQNSEQENQNKTKVESQDKNSTSENGDPEAQASRSKDNPSHQQNPNSETQDGQTGLIKTTESFEGIKMWLIAGSGVIAVLALAFTLRTCIKYKWWNPFRRFKQDNMFKQSDELEA